MNVYFFYLKDHILHFVHAHLMIHVEMCGMPIVV